MKEIKYSLIVSDFDGTFVKADGSVGEKTKTEMNRYIQNGGIFAISTGRKPIGILSRARQLGLKGAVSCYQGAVIMDIQTEEVLRGYRLDNELAVQVCEKMEEMNVHTHVYGLTEYYSNKEGKLEDFYMSLVGGKYILKSCVTEFLEETKLSPYKLMALTEKSDLDWVYNELTKLFGDKCYIATSTSEGCSFVEICDIQCNKGTTMEFLAEYYNVPLSKTIGVGDQRNDIPMIEKAGLGVAVGNSHDQLKEKADITLLQTNEEDAVGFMIEQYAYSGN